MNGCEQVAQTMLVQDMMKKNNYLSALGFNMGLGGAHISRTMMLDELNILLAHTSRIDAEKKDNRHDNVYLRRFFSTIVGTTLT